MTPPTGGAAMQKSLLWGGEIPIGKFFERTDLPATRDESERVEEGRAGQTRQPGVLADVAKSFIDELM